MGGSHGRNDLDGATFDVKCHLLCSFRVSQKIQDDDKQSDRAPNKSLIAHFTSL